MFILEYIAKAALSRANYMVLKSARFFHRFVDQQQRLMRLKVARNQLQERCTRALEKHKQRDKLVWVPL